MNSEMMSSEAAIEIIDELFPIDYDNPDTVAIGRELLLLAITNSGMDWRDLPAPVLVEYARLSKDEEAVTAVTNDLIKREILFED